MSERTAELLVTLLLVGFLVWLLYSAGVLHLDTTWDVLITSASIMGGLLVGEYAPRWWRRRRNKET